MKKTLATIAALGVLAGNAMTYEVGDDMPKFERDDAMKTIFWERESKRGRTHLFDENRDGKPDYGISFVLCRKLDYMPEFDYHGAFYFSYFDFNNRNLLIDRNYDGKVDEKIEDGWGKEVWYGMPDCPVSS